MKTRLISISDLLAEYSLGNFDFKIPLSDKLDEFDSIISGINMLGEELKATTISRNFFSSVYDSVSTLLFTLNENGNVLDCNKAALQMNDNNDLFGHDLDNLLNVEAFKFSRIKKKLNKSTQIFQFETEVNFMGFKLIVASCSLTKIDYQSEKCYLFVLEDVTEKRESEKLLLQTIISAEENERKRLADDLHDSLGQRLSSMKMMLGVAKKNAQEENQLEILSASIKILEASIIELRNICFNLMPAVLETGGLLIAIQQLLESIPFKIELKSNVDTLFLNKKQEVAIYRVIQEFINNSIKHSGASKIFLDINQQNKKISIKLKDNGSGFKTNEDFMHDHRGLNTMKSRIESHGGQYQLSSSLGNGVKVNILFNYD